MLFKHSRDKCPAIIAKSGWIVECPFCVVADGHESSSKVLMFIKIGPIPGLFRIYFRVCRLLFSKWQLYTFSLVASATFSGPKLTLLHAESKINW